MIPRLAVSPKIDSSILHYVKELSASGFKGDIAEDYASRLSLSTDNSIYQLMPQAILFPRSTHDVQLIAQVASNPRFKAITFSPRGGGTGTNGQSLNNGIVVDLSRYMNNILEVNLDEKWVRVEAGVIKDQLNLYLKSMGYFFCPELSTSNRATIGGMINTDASGQGSMVYGKTSDHVLSVKAILINGALLETSKKTIAEAQKIATSSPIYKTVFDYCRQNRAIIEKKFPKLNRFLTGYDLKNVFDEKLTEFDLTRIITGSEGTLAFITEAKLNIIAIPKYRYLINIKYDSFSSALANAPFLVSAKALSVETIDSSVLELAKQDIIWQSVESLITDVEGQSMQGINLVEFAGKDRQQIVSQLDSLTKQLDELMQNRGAGIIGYQVCAKLDEIEKIYTMRKKAVGLLGNTKGRQKPIPFVEDTCVPPENLANYIAEFRALLDSHHLSYGMFGHVDSGVLHVRPAIDMCNLQQEKLVKEISDQVVALTAKYNGLLWGEHGKGFRSEYSPTFFGEELYQGLRTIKAAFDPDNRLNPGKICTPLSVDAPILSITSVSRGFYDRQIPINVRQQFRGATECNGNGLCFNFDRHSPMCPSMKWSNNRVFSPKGRATLVREWLRLMINAGVTENELNVVLTGHQNKLVDLVKKINNSWRAKKGEYDFSHEVKETMDYCLSCKACSTQCPIKIDVPEFKARFLALYHTRYLRPIRDYFIASVESFLPMMSKAPNVVNFLLQSPLTNAIASKTLAMTDFPLLSVPTLSQKLDNDKVEPFNLGQLKTLSDYDKADYVLVVLDPFTTYYDAEVVYDFVCLCKKLGFKPVVLPFKPNGKAQHVKGFVNEFIKTAKSTADFLSNIATLGIPMVGVDPALVLCYRDEYRVLLENNRGNFDVLLSHEWLKSILKKLSRKNREISQEWFLLGHCTETTQLPASGKEWQQIFKQLGMSLNVINVGCCGMAGTFGHEVNNLAASREIFQLSWKEVLNQHPTSQFLATGYSCRSQVKRFGNVSLKHPIQALLANL